MAKRKIVNIDASLCNGCGLCISSCAEGAIQLVDGVAKLVKDDYCDGLGACLGECPQGAISVIEREAAEFDEAATEKHLENIGRKPAPVATPAHHAGCPGMAMRQFTAKSATAPAGDTPSALRQWPVQWRSSPRTGASPYQGSRHGEQVRQPVRVCARYSPDASRWQLRQTPPPRAR